MGKSPNEIEINNSTDRKFKVIVIRMLTKLRKRVEEHSKNFNKELKNISVKNIIIDMKNTQVEINSKLIDTHTNA